MAKSDTPSTIQKYANPRLYNTGTSTYVTLEDLAAMVKKGEDFLVHDAKTGEDITRSVLTQIIFEQENKEGQNLLPINFLRQLIRFYGDSMQMLVPRYLEVSLESLTREQEKFRQHIAQAFGGGPFGALEDQARRYMAMVERALQVIAAPGGEDRGRRLVLHPFGHGLEPEPASQIDQRVHEGAVVLRAREVLHEGAVDLHDIDAELAQIAERGVAGAEIVDGDTAAEILDPRDEAAGFVNVVDRRRLRDLDREPLGDARLGAQ